MEKSEQLQELIQAIQELNQRLAWFQDMAESHGKAKKRIKSFIEYKQDNAQIYQEVIQQSLKEEWKDYIRLSDADGRAVNPGEDGAVYVGICVPIFNKFFLQRHLSEKDFLHWAQEHGLLLKGSDGRFSRVARYPGGGQLSRFITLQLCVNDKPKDD